MHRIQGMPFSHPLTSVFSEEFRALLKDQIDSTTDRIPWNDGQVLEELPTFVRVIVSSIDDKLSLMSPDQPQPAEETGGGLEALINKVGLVPSEAVTAEHTERVRIFDEKSRLLSEIFTESWVRDVQAEFVPFNQDKDLGLAITCQGSLDPPSRRSQGFKSYLGLTAKLLELGGSSDSDLLLLLDDPAMHLHPTAQEKLATLLGQQSFQVLAATHFPFMITPDRLDRVRLLCRTDTGAYLEEDWQQAGDGLLPVKGALSKWTLGRIAVVVEGIDDSDVLIQMSELLNRRGQDHLYDFAVPLPGGGSMVPHAAKALRAMDLRFIALVDGDQAGEDIKQKLISEIGMSDTSVVSLRDVVQNTNQPTIESLFSTGIRDSAVWINQELPGTLRSLRFGRLELDDESASNLKRLFQMLNDALDRELGRN